MAGGEWDDPGPQLAVELGGEAAGGSTSVDDEYRWAGVEDPKVIITTSRDPSSKLKQFAKVRICCFSHWLLYFLLILNLNLFENILLWN